MSQSIPPLDPEDPFPAGAPGQWSYAEEQALSTLVDDWLGIEAERIEAALAEQAREEGATGARRAEGQNLWIGLPVKTLLTPYMEIRRLLAQLAPPPGSAVVDLGAGYGRMGFVLGRHWPQVKFVGYECVAARVREATRCLAPWGYGDRVRVELADLHSPEFRPIAAEFYFLYDFGSHAAIRKTLDDLKRIASSRPITVIGRGRASRNEIERGHPWLSQVVPPAHFAHYSIYRTAG